MQGAAHLWLLSWTRRSAFWRRPLTVKPNPAHSEHIRHWTSSGERKGNSRQGGRKRETEYPMKEDCQRQHSFYCRIQIIVLRFLSSLCGGNNSELYVLEIHKSAELVELLWRLKNIRFTLNSIRLLIWEENAEKQLKPMLVFCQNSFKKRELIPGDLYFSHPVL